MVLAQEAEEVLGAVADAVNYALASVLARGVALSWEHWSREQVHLGWDVGTIG